MCDILSVIVQYLQPEDQYSLMITYPLKQFLLQCDYSGDLIDILITKNAANIIKKIYKTKLCCNRIFQWAARYGHLEVVKFLAVLSNIDVTTNDNYAIDWAVKNGHLDIDASIDNNRIICSAAESGHLDVVKYLATLPSVQKVGNLPKI